jgi:hypothetical protein
MMTMKLFSLLVYSFKRGRSVSADLGTLGIEFSPDLAGEE